MRVVIWWESKFSIMFPKKSFRLFCGVCILGIPLCLIDAQIIFQQTFTGAQLWAQNGSSVHFNSGIGVSAVGTDSIQIDPSGNNQILFRWDLLPAQTRGNLVFNITVNYTPLSGDNDPIFLISDGSYADGVLRMDGGSAKAQGYADLGWAINSYRETSILSGLGTVNEFSFQILMLDESTGTSLLNYTELPSFTPANTSISYAYALDSDRYLSFVMASSSVASSELYQINAINVTVSSIPEPSFYATLLGLFSVVMLGVLRLRGKCEV